MDTRYITCIADIQRSPLSLGKISSVIHVIITTPGYIELTPPHPIIYVPAESVDLWPIT